MKAPKLLHGIYTLPTDQLFNLEFQFESLFNFELHPKSGIQIGIPTQMGIVFWRVNQTGLTQKYQNQGLKVEVKYMDEPCNDC